MKIVYRYDYRARRMAIARQLGVEDAEQGIVDLYVNESLSAIEISERLALAKISFTPRSIHRIIKLAGKSRSATESFNLAISRGRVKWAYKDPRMKIATRQINKVARYKILKRDGFKCVLCGITAKDSILEVDHIIAKCHGGKDEPENLRTLCHDCNTGKRIIEQER